MCLCVYEYTCTCICSNRYPLIVLRMLTRSCFLSQPTNQLMTVLYTAAAGHWTDEDDTSQSTTSSLHVPGPCFSVYELRNKLFQTLSPNAVYIYTYKNQIKSFKLPIHWVYCTCATYTHMQQHVHVCLHGILYMCHIHMQQHVRVCLHVCVCVGVVFIHYRAVFPL